MWKDHVTTTALAGLYISNMFPLLRRSMYKSLWCNHCSPISPRKPNLIQIVLIKIQKALESSKQQKEQNYRLPGYLIRI